MLRLLQEALSNVIKHAGARTVGISARVADGAVLVRVVDDGGGFDPAAAAAGRRLAPAAAAASRYNQPTRLKRQNIKPQVPAIKPSAAG